MPTASGVRVTIYGSEDATALATKLIRAGDGRLKRDLYDAIRYATIGVEAELRASALAKLPKRGGLAREVATARMSVRRIFADPDGVGVRIGAYHQYDLEGIDSGLVIAPNWGGPKWHTQAVPPGWFSDVVNNRARRTRGLIDKACAHFARSI